MLSIEHKHMRIIHYWEETWEKKTVGPNGHAKLEARLVRKYGGLQKQDFLLTSCLLSTPPRLAEINHSIGGKPRLVVC